MKSNQPAKVMQIIARMNVGGPAILVADLMRNLDSSKFEARLVTGYCDENESDYLDEVATDIKAIRIAGFGKCGFAQSDLETNSHLCLTIVVVSKGTTQQGLKYLLN